MCLSWLINIFIVGCSFLVTQERERTLGKQDDLLGTGCYMHGAEMFSNWKYVPSFDLL